MLTVAGDSGGTGHSASRSHLPRLRWAFFLTLGFLCVEVVVALTTGSLAVTSDAGHMAADVAGLGMAWAAVSVAARTGWSTGRQTFGLYRLEILAAAANALLMLVVAGYVLVEAAGRLADPEPVPGLPLLLVAVAGLGVNLLAARLLSAGAQESLNVRGAYLEVVADLVGSVGVLAAAVVILTTGWTEVDALVGAAVGLIVIPRALVLGANTGRILLQVAPRRVDLDRVGADLAGLDGVADVHDLHVWTLTSSMDVASAHLLVTEEADLHRVLHAARDVLQERHGIAHATVQIEPQSHRDCVEIDW